MGGWPLSYNSLKFEVFPDFQIFSNSWGNLDIACLLVIIKHASFHLWWKENLVKHQNVSKYHDQDCSFPKFHTLWLTWRKLIPKTFPFQDSSNTHSLMMEFFYKILLSEEVFKKINIFGFIFKKKKKKKQIWSKKPKICFHQLKLTLAEEGYRFFWKKSKCLGSNKNVNVAFFA